MWWRLMSTGGDAAHMERHLVVLTLAPVSSLPAKTAGWPAAGLRLGKRRWPNLKPAVGQPAICWFRVYTPEQPRLPQNEN